MSSLDLARWQFGLTTVYHYLFVPLTIGLSILVAGMQTAWYRKREEKYLRMTKFWGKLLLINFAIGVVTGIVQEFQFGMNWSDYSRFVGDVFGAPLAMEGLIAFFLESTFLGLWIFGWDKLSPRLHLMTIWLAAIGTNISAYFILAANSWMQHPVGFTIDAVHHRAHLTSIMKVLTNSTALVTYPHTITAAFVTAGVVIVAVSSWHLARKNEIDFFRTSLRLGLATTVIATVAVFFTGDLQARLMTKQQPMKMAAAEALYSSAQPASFSLFTIGTLDGNAEVFSVRVPHLLSELATGSPDGKVEGINDLQALYEQKYGPGSYKPNIWVTYWTFRLMIGFGLLAGAVALVGLYLHRKDRAPQGTRFYQLATLGLVLPFLANTAGWVFTEMGRQPWTVFGVLKTPASVSPSVGTGPVAISLIGFTVLYGALAAIAGRLMVRHAKRGPAAIGDLAKHGSSTSTPTFAY